MRQLEKQINKALRKLAFAQATDGQLPYNKITARRAEDLLGKPPFYRDIYQGNDYAGVVTGLAWTSVGGEILFIETSLSKGKAGKLTLTGNLGDVMKESAVIALEYVKAHIDTLGRGLPRLRELEHPHTRAGGRHAQGRPIGRHNHSHIVGLGAYAAQGEAQHRHDGRDNASRQGAARGWNKGEDSRRRSVPA